MYRKCFPKCPIDGPIEPPKPFAHFISHGTIPNKCSTCDLFFEGECTRFMDLLERYSALDHGPCGVPGPTDPVAFHTDTDGEVSKYEVPRKCLDCRFLKRGPLHEPACGKDAEIWGDFSRTFDWGNWGPDFIDLKLPIPKLTTRRLVETVNHDDQIGFIKEYRRINPGSSILDAKADFACLRRALGRLRSAKNGGDIDEESTCSK